MDNISKKYEFLYKLGEKYYRIGSRACEEYSDAETKQYYDKYCELIEDELFVNLEPAEMPLDFCKSVAEAYEKVRKKCNVCENENRRNDLLLRRLENQYGDALQEQIALWKKADDCKMEMDIKKLQSKNK